ncbi:hypothetical protein [Nonomuraea sp. NPDC050786]|uniref:hypothetical protein n=1 Tax=Nonomuraea sp. NPDC050786 TaxID=3154840 RepID=UPI0033D5829A
MTSPAFCVPGLRVSVAVPGRDRIVPGRDRIVPGRDRIGPRHDVTGRATATGCATAPVTQPGM